MTAALALSAWLAVGAASAIGMAPERRRAQIAQALFMTAAWPLEYVAWVVLNVRRERAARSAKAQRDGRRLAQIAVQWGDGDLTTEEALRIAASGLSPAPVLRRRQS